MNQHTEPSPSPDSGRKTPHEPGTWWAAALREPLLHFLALGMLLFALDYALLERRGDPRRIEVPASAYEEARSLLGGKSELAGNAGNLNILIDRWVDNEVLYREGLAMGLDKGDSAIRDRVIFKALTVTQSGIELPRLESDTLTRWFESNRKRYDTPARYDFLEAVPAGDRSEEKLRAAVAALNSNSPGDTEASLNVFRDRPRSNIEGSYGPEFAQLLDRAKPGEWMLLPSMAGPRVIRLQEIKPAIAADFESIKNQVLQDWKDDTMSRLTTQAVRDLASRYRVIRKEAA